MKHGGKREKLTSKQRAAKAARNVRRDRQGVLLERRAGKAGIIVARDLSSLRRTK